MPGVQRHREVALAVGETAAEVDGFIYCGHCYRATFDRLNVGVNGRRRFPPA
jgi:hypothetical protein